MEARMKNPGLVIPDAMTAIRSLNDAIQQGGVPQRTLDLVHLRASQINGCAVCLGAATNARHDGETDQRLFTLIAWRDSPYFTGPERAALALTQAVTRLADQHRPGTRRDLGRGRPPLRREGARRPRPLDRPGQRLQPRQRHHPSSSRATATTGRSPAARDATSGCASGGVLVPTLTSEAISAVAPGLRGAASAAFNTARQVGGAVGVATIGPLLGTGSLHSGFIRCLLACAAAAALALTTAVTSVLRGTSSTRSLRTGPPGNR
jgi:AhpD family alkylhydroperoxidase